jgi:class 3 adenylate cyclase
MIIIGKKLQFRYGINSGPVIAGVYRDERNLVMTYGGDSVNIASRMESHGTGGDIQIYSSHIRTDQNDFTCISHGTVNIKGKGEMPVWFVLGRKNLG